MNDINDIDELNEKIRHLSKRCDRLFDICTNLSKSITGLLVLVIMLLIRAIKNKDCA